MTIKELEDLMVDLLIDFGPDGHCDGYERISREIFDRVEKWK